METYVVKFWFTNDSGYREQTEVEVVLKTHSKSAHSKAEKALLNMVEWKDRRVEVVSVSVTYV